ncbi:UNVERIFIED_CONTAM: Ldh family oxidoreductase [Microbacterium sp. SLM126]
MTLHVVDVDRLTGQVSAIFESAGADPATARLVADDLVDGDRSGIPSHGVVRTGEYLDAIAASKIHPAARPTVVFETPALVVIDGQRGFGQVVSRVALDTAAAKARTTGAAVAVVRNSHHMGRIGALCEAAAAEGLLSLALVAVGMPGPVAPLGAKEGRLGTNPIAYGIPHGARPIVADFATSAMPEGIISLRLRTGQDLPPGVLVDSTGQPTTDPAALYTDPPGAILPFGGPWAHRGFAMNLMVELFAGTLAGYGPTDDDRPSNCLFLLLVDPRVLPSGSAYDTLVRETTDYVRSAAAAGDRGVTLPGDLEADSRERNQSGVPVAEETLALLAQRGAVPFF